MSGKRYFPKTSIVITVFNEEQNITKLISALRNQSMVPLEVIIVDGESKDQTYSLLQSNAKSWPVLKIFQVPGNRSVGRNFGVSKSHFPIIVFTDAGCIPEKNWLEELVKPFSDPNTQVVSGYYKGLPQNSFQKCLVPYVLVMPDKADKTEFYPSTRSMAVRRSVWDQSGGFDPKLNHNEDYAYAHWLKKIGVKFTFVPNAVVGWMPRKNLKQASWMFMRFAIGDVQAGIIRPKVKFLFIRYLAFIYLFFFAMEVHQLITPLILVCLLYFIWVINKNYRYVKNPLAIFWLPIIQITADLSVIFGTLTGFMAKANGLF